MKHYDTSVARAWFGLTTAVLLFFLLGSLALGQSPKAGVVNRNANLRAGPGTTYAIVGRVTQGQTVIIVTTNAAGDWY